MLTALALGIAGLLAAGAAAAALEVPLGVPLGVAPRPRPRPAAGWLAHGAGLVASGGFLAVGLAVLVTGAPAGPMPLPFGSVAGAGSIALDPLSAWFLLPLGVSGMAASLFALARPPAPARAVAPFPLFLAGMALTLAAADGFTLLVGFEAMSLASWVLVAAGHDRPENRAAARRYLMFAAFSAACLVPALGLLAGPGRALDFASLRAAPPDGARATAVLVLALLGAGAKAGLVPLHAWLPQAHPAAPSHVSALMSGAMTKVALYVLARLLLDLCGPAQPAWWGVPLLALGAASAVLGALRAALEEEAKALLACSTIENIGFIAMALGLVLAFRGADLAPLAGLAAAAALLHALNHGVFKTLLFLGLGAVAEAAGSRRLDRLGGLIHAMPATAGAVLVGAAAAAALPPSSGFASEWLLLQALLAGWRVGEIGLQIAVAAAVALAALAAALGAAAMVRLFGLVFLGRPRTPRGAGAREPSRPERAAVLLPAALTLLLGLCPGPLLGLAAGAVPILAGGAATVPVRGLGLVVAEGGASYWPVGAALGLAGLAGAILLLVRRLSPLPAARGPVWNGGFIDPPAFLPFGDPLTQPGAGGMAQPLRRMLGTALLAARETVERRPPGDPRPGAFAAGFEDPTEAGLLRPLVRLRDALATQAEALRGLSLRGCLWLAFATLAGLLALLAWAEAR